MSYAPLNKDFDDEKFPVEMERLPRIASMENGKSHSFENAIEAKVEEGDSLQALALRFRCTVSDSKNNNTMSTNIIKNATGCRHKKTQ